MRRAGTLRAFLSDGTLVMTSCVETYRLAPWRWVEGAQLVWEEDGRSIRAEVVLAERTTMVLVVDLGDESVTARLPGREVARGLPGPAALSGVSGDRGTAASLGAGDGRVAACASDLAPPGSWKRA